MTRRDSSVVRAAMSLRSIRDKIARWSLIAAGILFVGDWYCRVSFWHINENYVGETTTPAGVVQAWLLLLLLTLVSGLASIPRWQSFVALACASWVVLMTLQGHWP